MRFTTREFVRNLAKAKAAAAQGKRVEIVDKDTGQVFQLIAGPRLTFRDVASRDAGSVRSGRSDLSMIEGLDE